MKIKTLFFLIIFPLLALGQNTQKANLKRTQYYNSGMVSSITYYDSLLNNIVTQRIKEKTLESDFLTRYYFYENLYKNQQQSIAILADKWSALPKDESTKNIIATLDLVSKGQINQGIHFLRTKLGKVIKDSNAKKEYNFLAELYKFKGDYPNAMQLYQKVVSSPYNNTQDMLNLAQCNNMVFRLANDSMRVSKEPISDTIGLVLSKIIRSASYPLSNNINDGLGALIEAQLLLENYSIKDSVQIDLMARIMLLQANLQQQSNDFEVAFKNSNLSSEIYLAQKNHAGYAEAIHTLAKVYRRAGATDKADSSYNKCLALYTTLMEQYSELYEPMYNTVLEEYNEVLKWYDRNDAYENNLKLLAASRKKMMQNNFPFYALDYAHTLNMLGQKLLDVNLKIYLAEDQWLISKVVLEKLYKKHPMLTGNQLCNVLYKLGGVKISLKKWNLATPSFVQSLAVREYLYKLAPLQNKKDLMILLFQNAHMNNTNNADPELIMSQLNIAKILADELGEKVYSEEITVYTIGVLKKL